MHHAMYCTTLVEVNIPLMLFAVRLVSNRDSPASLVARRLSVASHVQGLAKELGSKAVLH